MFYNFQLTFELNKMVDIYEDDYKFKILRYTLENFKGNEDRENIYIIIHTLNDICGTLFNMFNNFDERYRRESIDNFFELYFKNLQKNSNLKTDIIYFFKDGYRRKLQKDILDDWSNIGKRDIDLNNNGNFLEMFDDFHQNCIIKNESIFIKTLGELKNLYRAQRGEHFDDYERMIPKPEYVKNKNRWNPEGVAFIYLGYDDKIRKFSRDINHIEKTCFEELRLKENEHVSTCKFKPLEKNAKIINLIYEDTSYNKIEDKPEKFMSDLVNSQIGKINDNLKDQIEIIDNIFNDEDIVIEIIKNELDREEISSILRKETEVFLGSLIMKLIDEAIFLPIDDVKDPEFKAYVPFHYLANYLISKGYSGILYRSTRMNKIGLKGKNLVLFNKEDVVVVPDSMRVYDYDIRKYNKP